MTKKYFLIETDSWSDETKITEYQTREAAVEAMELKYVSYVLNHEFYNDDETFITEKMAQFSDGYRITQFRLAELGVDKQKSCVMIERKE